MFGWVCSVILLGLLIWVGKLYLRTLGELKAQKAQTDFLKIRLNLEGNKARPVGDLKVAPNITVLGGTPEITESIIREVHFQTILEHTKRRSMNIR